jgi:hypothetical protein
MNPPRLMRSFVSNFPAPILAISLFGTWEVFRMSWEDLLAWLSGRVDQKLRLILPAQ